MKTIVTTVGTSLFSNYGEYVREEGKENLIAKHVEEIKDENASAYTDFADAQIARIRHVFIKTVEDWLSQPSASAEIQSVEKFIEENQLSDEQVSVYLLATDTILSRLAAEIICEVLNKNHPGIATFEPEYGKGIIEGLTVKPKEKGDPNFFDKGLMNLVERVNQLIDQAKKDKGDVVLNISGGYKGVIPVMTIIGQLEGVPLIYQYEDSDSLVKIGGLPVNFDMSLVYSFYPFYTDREEIEVTNVNRQILTDLDQKYGLFRPVINGITGQVKSYKRTILGKLLNSYAYYKAPESRQVLGLLVEYKLYEYYNKLTGYSSVEREAKVSEKTTRTFDLVLNKGEVLIEAKSADQVYFAFDEGKKDNLFNQVDGQFKDLKKIGSFPKKFIIYFYFVGKRDLESDKIIKDNLRKLGSYIAEFTEKQTALTAYYSEFGLNLLKESSNNPYKSLMQKELKVELFPID
jgi:putative CRISPR-associated protein (TIGR02619 family)